MLAPFNQNWRTSSLPFSLALQNTVNTGGSYVTPSGTVANQKYWASRGFQGYGPLIQYGPGAGMDGVGCGCNCGGNCGMGGLTFDGTGLFGTGLFSGDVSSWGLWEGIAGLIGVYAVYAMFFQAKQTKYRVEMARGRQRKRKATRLRAKAARLEAKTTGIF